MKLLKKQLYTQKIPIMNSKMKDLKRLKPYIVTFQWIILPDFGEQFMSGLLTSNTILIINNKINNTN